MDVELTVRFTAERWHRWPEAKGVRGYLAHTHRHLFHVEVTTLDDFDDPAELNDRSLELHDLLDLSKSLFGQLVPSQSDMSVETMAYVMAKELSNAHGSVRVTVFEDGEVGATLSYP